MSSTNRSNARDSHISDYYVTPISDIEIFLEKLIEVERELVYTMYDENARIVDCCAGGNLEVRDERGIKEIYHPMSYPEAIQKVFIERSFDTYDIREDSLAEHKCDYLTTKLDFEPDLIITNPPFGMAIPMIEKALSDVKDGGYVVMLLRLNFFGSKERKAFFDKYMPKYCFVHHVRIGFTEKKDSDGYVLFDKNGVPKRGSTDSIEYAHYVWVKGENPDHTELYLI